MLVLNYLINFWILIFGLTKLLLKNSSFFSQQDILPPKLKQIPLLCPEKNTFIDLGGITAFDSTETTPPKLTEITLYNRTETTFLKETTIAPLEDKHITLHHINKETGTITTKSTGTTINLTSEGTLLNEGNTTTCNPDQEKTASLLIDQVTSLTSTSMLPLLYEESTTILNPKQEKTAMLKDQVTSPQEIFPLDQSITETTQDKNSIKLCNNFTVCHLNIRSLNNKFSDLKSYILQNSYSAIAISESWLNVDLPDSLYQIPNYTMVRQDRATRGGGLVLYVLNNIKIDIIEIPLEEPSPVEFLIVKLTFSKVTLGLGVIYRPPFTNYTSLSILSDIVVNFAKLKIENFIMLGDININLVNDNAMTRFFNNLLLEYDCKQSIKTPTRVTDETEALIDIIISNSDLNITAQVSSFSLSDHNLIECTLTHLHHANFSLKKQIRCFKNFDLQKFHNDADLVDWNRVYFIPELNDKVSYFNSCLLKLFDIHAPVKSIVCSNKRPSQPWFNDTLHVLKKRKKKAWLKYRKTRYTEHKSHYCFLRNLYNYSIKFEKRNYFTQTLNSHRSDSKLLWSDLKMWNIHNKDKTLSLPPNFDNANEINNFFLESVPDLTAQPDYLDKFFNASFSDDNFEYVPVEPDTIKLIIIKQKPYTMGLDNISARMLQLALSWVVEPLTHIINYSFETGKVPDMWKNALVKPIPKKSNIIKNLSDLRPISLLSVPLKIAEAALHAQLTDYVESLKILPPSQSGYRKGYSTVTALCSMTDDFISAMDNHKLNSLTLLDMTKAFDSIDLNCLVAKLHYYGIRNNCLQWFHSYLFNRNQCTVVHTSENICVSDSRPINAGVPQGSILGPLLFSIFISDLQYVIESCNIYLFADDILLKNSFTLDNEQNAIIEINADLNRIKQWTYDNTLQLNAAKSQHIFIGSNQNISKLENFSLKINDEEIPTVDHVKNLGVIFDQKLKFTKHVDLICRKAYLSLKQLFPFKEYLDVETKKMLINNLVLSHINYADIVYGPCLSLQDKSRIQKMQNHCIRFITDVPRYAHITPYIRELGLLKQDETRFVHYSCFLNKILTTGLPEYLAAKIIRRDQVHERNLRNITSRLTVPSHRSAIFQTSFSYLSSYIQNNLSTGFQNLSVPTFKLKLKQSILDCTLNNIDFTKF